MDSWPACLPRDPRFYTRRAFTGAFGMPLTALVCAVQPGPPLFVLPVVQLAVGWHLYFNYKCYWRALVPEGPPTPYVRSVVLGFVTGAVFAALYAVAFL